MNQHTKLTDRKGNEYELIDNALYGNTYEISRYIKNYMGGTWNPVLKAWIVDLEKTENYLSIANAIGLHKA